MGKDSRSNMERYCESRASVVECGCPSAAFGLQDGVTGACTWRYRRIEKRQKRQAHSTTLARGSVALGASAPLRVFHRNSGAPCDPGSDRWSRVAFPFEYLFNGITSVL